MKTRIYAAPAVKGLINEKRWLLTCTWEIEHLVWQVGCGRGHVVRVGDVGQGIAASSATRGHERLKGSPPYIRHWIGLKHTKHSNKQQCDRS